jgi:prepilin-type N-terminal cleavage/methylation domain-containing protein
MQKNKGFTLIELLVVIAIIGILASIVLASLSTARQKGADAKIQAQISNMRAQAELFYNSQVPASYGTPSVACTGAGTLFGEATGLQALLVGLAAPVCNSTATTWAVSQELSTVGSFFCADSTGVAEVGTKVSDATGVCVTPTP